MTYCKPELISAGTALAAIRGYKWILLALDVDIICQLVTVAAYDVDE